MRKTILIIFLLPALSFSQSEKKHDVWESLKYFVVSWAGTGKGQPGSSTIERDKQFTETFELAAPGKQFEVYTQVHFRRKK